MGALRVFVLFITPNLGFAIRQAFQDPQNALASWDANYMSPCTFAYVECDP